MKTKPVIFYALTGLVVSSLVIACASTKTSESWSSKSYKGQIKNVYIIGLAKDELNRMIFEDAFEKRLVNEGVKAISSYKDLLPTKKKLDREDIMERMNTYNCDSVLLTKLVGRRTEGSMTGGKGSYVYTPMPYDPVPRRLPNPSSYYANWGNYYNYGTMNYVEAGRADFVILKVESVLYDLKTEELIWSAQLETSLQGNIEKMMGLFVDEVIKDLKGKGLI